MTFSHRFPLWSQSSMYSRLGTISRYSKQCERFSCLSKRQILFPYYFSTLPVFIVFSEGFLFFLFFSVHVLRYYSVRRFFSRPARNAAWKLGLVIEVPKLRPGSAAKLRQALKLNQRR